MAAGTLLIDTVPVLAALLGLAVAERRTLLVPVPVIGAADNQPGSPWIDHAHPGSAVTLSVLDPPLATLILSLLGASVTWHCASSHAPINIHGLLVRPSTVT